MENIFNSNTNNLDTSRNEIDLLYNIKIKYINLQNLEFNKLKNNFPNLNAIDYELEVIFNEIQRTMKDGYHKRSIISKFDNLSLEINRYFNTISKNLTEIS